MKELIIHSTVSGGRVLDPFAGSGSTILAAKQIGRKFVGIERQQKYYEQIVTRLVDFETTSKEMKEQGIDLEALEREMEISGKQKTEEVKGGKIIE